MMLMSHIILTIFHQGYSGRIALHETNTGSDELGEGLTWLTGAGEK